LQHINEANPSEFGDYELIIIGGPSHGGGMSDPMKEYMAKITDGSLDGMNVAAFDTRLM